MKNLAVFILVFFHLASHCMGQVWYSGDCDYAYPITTGYYSAPSYAIPAQLDSFEINETTSCIPFGENNGHWFEFLTLDTGIVCFNIVPNQPTNDYDWALFDITGHTCYEIRSIDSLEVRCNYSNSVTNGGSTGANGSTNNQDEPTVHVNPGQFFKLYLHNFSGSSGGFQLDFSCSTCGFNPILGIENQLQSSNIKLGPNPTSGQLNIYLNPLILDEIESIEITDLFGRTLIGQNQNFSLESRLDLSSFQAGIYFASFHLHSQWLIYKILKE